MPLDYEDYYLSQGLVPNADGTEWTLPVEGYEPSAAARAASITARGVKRSNPLPVADDRGHPFGPLNPEAPGYLIEPDLQETQAGLSLPTNMYQDAGGQILFTGSNQPVPIARRPGILPITQTPEGIKVVMPKMLDIVGNVMGNVAAPKVAAKAGEMVLGSGIVRKAAEETGPFFSQLERVVEGSKINLATPEQWLGYLKNQPGVKSEELGLVLKDMPTEGMISKEQLSKLVKENKVELKEKVLGGEADKLYQRQSEIQRQLQTEKDINKRTDLVIEQEKLRQEIERTNSVKSVTKYHSYQLPGGDNYKETLLSLPEKLNKRNAEINKRLDEINNLPVKEHTPEIYKEFDALRAEQKDLPHLDIGNYKSSHWDEPNVLAHIRHNDRTVEGKKTLHLEEIQSDWHQAGRKQGYKLTEGQKQELSNIDNKLMNGLTEKDIGNPDMDAVLKTALDKKVLSAEEAKNYKEFSKGENSNIPDAPFKKTWDELALKRMLHKAANEGYEGLSWTPGEAQAARYDLSKQVSQINYNPKTGYNRILDIKGNNISPGIIPKEKLADTIGKEAAEKILAKEPNNLGIYTLEGEGLKIGGEGMKSFYDKMLVDRANAIAKKYGSKVEQKNLNPVNHSKIYDEYLDNLKNRFEADVRKEAMKDGKVSKEFVDKHVKTVISKMEPWNYSKYFNESEKHKKLWDAKVEFDKTGHMPIHYLPITPELRAKAKEGFPLFSSSSVIIPVDKPPEFEDKKKYRLVPVDQPPVF